MCKKLLIDNSTDCRQSNRLMYGVVQMDQKSVVHFKKWFHAYVKSYASDDFELQRNFDLKEKHTFRVCMEITRLGKGLGLNGDEQRLAEVIALFHDIGRFQQYARYRTFQDGRSLNHAELGVAILREKEVLDHLDAASCDLILNAIAHHNKAALPQCEDKRSLFFTQLLRDADKLDIWRVVTDYYRRRSKGERNPAIELDLPDTPDISRGVCGALMAQEIVQAAHIRNLNDFKLLQVGWVYDLNFAPAFGRLVEKGYLEMIRATLPDSAAVREIFSAVDAYLDERMPGQAGETRPQSQYQTTPQRQCGKGAARAK